NIRPVNQDLIRKHMLFGIGLQPARILRMGSFNILAFSVNELWRLRIMKRYSNIKHDKENVSELR
ncbi:MAG: hypothetical protein WB988_13360, partial [Candidatus Nitrosopolaris sp.]